MKYDLSESQNEILPNLLGLKSVEEIGLSEFEGFLKAEIIFTENLTPSTKFTTTYIQEIYVQSICPKVALLFHLLDSYRIL